VLDQQLAQREEDVGALGERGLTPANGAFRATATTSSTSDASATGTCALTSPVAGLKTSMSSPALPFDALSVDEV
jgi:hypothetical protein